MNGGLPPNQPVFPGGADYWAQISGLMQQQFQTEAARLNGEYKKMLDAEVEKIAEGLKNDVAKRVRAVVLAVIGVIAAGFAILAYAETRSLSATSSGYYDAVMGLQKEVLATSNNLGEKVSLIAAANKELDISERQLESTRKDLQTLVESVTRTKGELDTAKRCSRRTKNTRSVQRI
jgi:hypothetical protein